MESRETARLTDERIELSSEEVAKINSKLNEIIEDIKSQPEVSITYFIPDDKKSGGAYATVKGNVRRIDEVNRIIYLTDDTKILIYDILKIDVI